MSGPPDEVFVTPRIIDYGSWWRGKSQGADFYVHNAINEIIDNSITHVLRPPVASIPRDPTIEVILVDFGAEGIQLTINDNGGGISYAVFYNTLMNPGSRPDEPGLLSEHGFGLKNALSFIQSGELIEFQIISKFGDDIWKLEGPYSSRMRLARTDEADWNNSVISERLRGNRISGTTISTRMTMNVLLTAREGSSRAGRARIFSTLVEILREHIMMTYRKILATNASLRLFVISKRHGEAEWHYGDPLYLRPDDNSIKIWEHEFEPITRQNAIIDYRMPNGIEYKIPLTMGRAPHDSKRDNGRYANLRYYYRLTDAKVGIDIFVRDRLIKSNEWEHIWDSSPTYSYNWVIGELELNKDFPTRNNKTNINHTASIWDALVNRINEMNIEPPEKETNVREHVDVLDLIRRKIISGPYRIVGGRDNVKIEETRVFRTSPIDLWFEAEQVGASNVIHIYELKIETTNPINAYQLKMYCDGYIKDNVIPDETFIQLHLVAEKHSEGTKDCIDYLRTLTDQRGNNYDIWLDKLDILYKPDGKTIRDITINSQWYPER